MQTSFFMSNSGSAWSCSPGRCKLSRWDHSFRPREDTRTGWTCERWRSFWLLWSHQRHYKVHCSKDIRERRKANSSGDAFLNRFWWTWLCRHGERPSRFRNQVLHWRRNLGFGWEQHADILHSWPDSIPKLPSHAKAKPPNEPERCQHVLGLYQLEAWKYSSSHVPIQRPWDSRWLQVHARLRQPHFQVSKRFWWSGILQIPHAFRSRHPQPWRWTSH